MANIAHQSINGSTTDMDQQDLTMMKSALGNQNVLNYVLRTNVYPREHEQLKKLRQVTLHSNPNHLMAVSPEEGQFLQLLVKIMNAKKTMEIGVFTGYSLLATALALPQDAQTIAIDMDLEAYEMGLPYIKEAGVDQKIKFIKAEAAATIHNMVEEGLELDSYDFVFVDADKTDYKHYHEFLVKLVKVGGLIAYDNTLWFGSVADPTIKSNNLTSGPEFELVRKCVLEFNQMIVADERVEIAQLCIGDGLTLCRRCC